MQKMKPRSALAITNPSKTWVVEELSRLSAEWEAWDVAMRQLLAGPDSPDFDASTCLDAIKDGFANRRRHAVLREKTLVFISNNFSGYEFLFDNWPTPPHEDNASRLAEVVPGWVHRLEMLCACVPYAKVPESFWKERGKLLADEVIKAGAKGGADIAASWLRNPFGSP